MDCNSFLRSRSAIEILRFWQYAVQGRNHYESIRELRTALDDDRLNIDHFERCISILENISIHLIDVDNFLKETDLDGSGMAISLSISIMEEQVCAAKNSIIFAYISDTKDFRKVKIMLHALAQSLYKFYKDLKDRSGGIEMYNSLDIFLLKSSKQTKPSFLVN